MTSAIRAIFNPTERSDLSAASRPAPGPLIYTSTSFMPLFMAFLAAASTAVEAANGVDLRAPLKPTDPELPHVMVLPLLSAMVTMVLLNVDVI